MSHALTLTQVSNATPELSWRYPLALLVAMWQTARERRQLSRLTDHELEDLGISHTAAAIEVARPFWDLPGRFEDQHDG